VHIRPADIPSSGGVYALLLHQRQPELRTHVGALGLLSFPRGI
jgi:hypothetical protein